MKLFFALLATVLSLNAQLIPPLKATNTVLYTGLESEENLYFTHVREMSSDHPSFFLWGVCTSNPIYEDLVSVMYDGQIVIHHRDHADGCALDIHADTAHFFRLITTDGTGSILTRADNRGRIGFNSTDTTNPVTATNISWIFSKAVGDKAEMFVKDGNGNVTQISPHAKNPLIAENHFDDDARIPPVVIHHQNELTGYEEWIHLRAAIRELETITGKQFIFGRQGERNTNVVNLEPLSTTKTNRPSFKR